MDDQGINAASPKGQPGDEVRKMRPTDESVASSAVALVGETLTIGEAARTLGVSISTLRNWDRQGKLPAARHPINHYRLYSREAILRVREKIVPYGELDGEAPEGCAESRFDIAFVAPLALAEKQIQQSYRPYIQVHKWFARRPGTLFRALLLSEFGDDPTLRYSYYQSHDLAGLTVLDPFIGGGTPVLEANRVGMNVVGCDINPMAAWIVRQELAPIDIQALRDRANVLIKDVEKNIQQYYQTKCKGCGGDATVKYFIWVKQLPCPNCSRSIELFPGYLVASNARHPNFVLFCPECRDLFEVESLPDRGASVTSTCCGRTWKNDPIARRNRYTCRACGHSGRYPNEFVPHGPPQHSLIAIEYHCKVCKPGHKGRFFKAPDEADRQVHREAAQAYRTLSGNALIPDDDIPEGDETTRLHRWGYRRFVDLFNDRQLLVLSKLAASIAEVSDMQQRHALATVFSDFLRYQNMLGRYDTCALKCQDIFSVHGFPVGLVQCENNVLGIAKVGTGGYRHFVEKYIAAKEYNKNPFEVVRSGGRKRRVHIQGEHISARFTEGAPRYGTSRHAWIACDSLESLNLAPNSIDAVLTDPPYFDNVQYAELMDFCYVWLRRLVNGDVQYFDALSTRTAGELTGNRTAGRDLAHFCEGLSRVYRAAACALKPGGLFAFTYHHNNVEAYLPVAVALLDAGVTATASLPCPAEMAASLHIARTGSSVVDTILCSRKERPGVVRPKHTVADVPALLRDQAAQLRSGGVKPTVGDLRCMALGLLTIVAINGLGLGWDASKPVEDRLLRTRGFFTAALDQLGGLEYLVETVDHPETPKPDVAPAQLGLSFVE
jgi:excisionase family DNA binding protein